MREIPDPGFAGDDGSADPALRAALAAAGARPDARVDARVDVLASLAGARLLVPVTAVAGEVEPGPDGLPREKDSDMAVVLLRGRDGRVALLAFTGADSLASWDPRARPVPVTGGTAARAAVSDGADAVVLDVAGPASFVVSGDDLTGLAKGWRPTRVASGYGWIRPRPE